MESESGLAVHAGRIFFGKPVPTFPENALAGSRERAQTIFIMGRMRQGGFRPLALPIWLATTTASTIREDERAHGAA
jgi:hypothetical protein